MKPLKPMHKKVMVVDDDLMSCELLKAVLTNKGFQAIGIMDSLEAMDKIEEDHPDLVILDLMMPRQGGLEIIRRMQQVGLKKIPIIVVTARHIDDSMKEMIKMEGNVLGVVGKPFRHDLFIQAVHHVLGTKPQYARAAAV